MESTGAERAPPQKFVTSLGLAIFKPNGRLSVKPTPVSETGFEVGLVTVMMRVDVSSSKMLEGTKTLVRTGGATIVSGAVAGAPSLGTVTSVDLIVLVILILAPSILAMTFAVIVQVAFGANMPPIKDIEAIVTVKVPVPLQAPAVPGGTPSKPMALRLSVKLSPVRGRAFGLVNLNVSANSVPRETVVTGTPERIKAFSIFAGNNVVLSVSHALLPGNGRPENTATT